MSSSKGMGVIFMGISLDIEDLRECLAYTVGREIY